MGLYSRAMDVTRGGKVKEGRAFRLFQVSFMRDIKRVSGTICSEGFQEKGFGFQQSDSEK